MKVFLMLVAFSVFGRTLAQETEGDTTRTYRMGEVVVTATRSSISVTDSPSPVEVIHSRAIQNSNGSTVADVLRSASSMVLKDYGGNAALKTASLRGTASEHLLILVNGNRFNSFQNGLADLSLVPLNDVERIEIVRGGASALYGADALGGVVNILTRPPGSDTRIQTSVAAGSFGYQKAFVEGQGRIGRLGLLTGFSREQGRDDYPFTTLRRTNHDFRREQIYLHGDAVIDASSAVTFSAQHVRSERGVPGSLIYPSDVARQNDNDVNLLLGYLDHRFDRLELSLRTAFHYNLQLYNDPTFFINSHYKNTYATLNPQAQFVVSSSQRFVLGGEFGKANLQSNDFDGRITRVHRSLYLSSESQFNFDSPVADRVSLYQTIRYDDISDVDFAFTPKFGINVRLVKEGDIRLRSSVGRNFRAPSFNDLYYRGFSNPDLQPERSTSFDIGLISTVGFYGWHRLEFTYFHLNTVNRILLDPETYLPRNIGRARTDGFEGKYEGQFLDGMIELGGNYSFTAARKRNQSTPEDPTYGKQLIYVPRHAANVTLSLLVPPLRMSVVHSVIGLRYTREDNSASTPAYRLTHANVAFDGTFGRLRMFVKAEVNNLFDKDYEVFLSYPMPKRHYRVTLSVRY